MPTLSNVRSTLITSSQNFLQKASSYCLSVSALQKASSYFTAGILTELALRRLPAMVFLNPKMPNFIYHYSYNVCKFEDVFNLFPNRFEQAIILPLVQGVLFRVGLQEIVVKKAQKAIFKAQPSQVNRKANKIARVIIASTAYTLARTQQQGSDLISSFVVGLITGAIQESTGSPILGMLFNIGAELPFALQSEAVDQLTPLGGRCFSRS